MSCRSVPFHTHVTKNSGPAHVPHCARVVSYQCRPARLTPLTDGVPMLESLQDKLSIGALPIGLLLTPMM